jgi:hypothetical protein
MGNEFGDGVFLGESSSSLRIEIAESDDLEEVGSGLISLDMLSADTGTDNDDSEGSDHGKGKRQRNTSLASLNHI